MLTLLRQTAASVSTPAAGKDSLYIDSGDGIPKYKDDLGVTHYFKDTRRIAVALGNITGAVTIDLSSGDIFTGTLTGDITLSLTNPPPAGYAQDAELRITQDPTGSRIVTWPAGGKWPGGTAFVPTPTAGATDYVGLSVLSDGTWTGYPVEDIA